MVGGWEAWLEGGVSLVPDDDVDEDGGDLAHVADDGEGGGGDGGAAEECKVAHRGAEGAGEEERGDLLLRPERLGEHVRLEGERHEEEEDAAP